MCDGKLSADQAAIITAWARETPEVLCVWVFGSRSPRLQKQPKPHSDLDLAILTADDQQFRLPHRWAWRLSGELGLTVKTHNYRHPPEIRAACDEGGELLFAR